ncbi:hypothetical protein ACROYT_G030541, partial [Oculina patagonica]
AVLQKSAVYFLLAVDDSLNRIYQRSLEEGEAQSASGNWFGVSVFYALNSKLFFLFARRTINMTVRLIIQHNHKHRVKPIELIERLHSRDQQPYWFTKTKDYFCIKIEFNSRRNGFVHQHWRHFFVLEHQYGCRDVI